MISESAVAVKKPQDKRSACLLFGKRDAYPIDFRLRVSQTRRGERARNTNNFQILVAGGGLFLAIWTSFSPPAATGLSVGVFVGGPLLFLVLDDLLRKRRAYRRSLVERDIAIDEALIGKQLDEDTVTPVAVADASHSDDQPIRAKRKERKWWARRWAGMRLGRFGIWH